MGNDSAFRHAVPEAVLARIGDVLVSFSMLERMLDIYVSALLDVPQRVGRCVCAGLSFTQVRQMTIALYKEKFGEDEDFAILDEILARAGRAEEHRNAVAHSEWGSHGDGSVERTKDRTRGFKGLQIAVTSHTAEDIGAIATEISEVTGAILQLWVRQGRARKIGDRDGALP